MDPAEFLKKIQARQDEALRNRELNKPTATVQRIVPVSGQPARIMISCDRPGFIDGQLAKRIWSEVVEGQGVGQVVVGAQEIEVRISGHLKMYTWLEGFLVRIMSALAYKGVEEFRVRGQWEKVAVRTGSFSRSEVQMSYFNTLE